jgi:hypothetical protein
MADKPRRPYLHLSDDEYASRKPQTAARSLFRQPSRYIREALAKESEFEKPYLSSDPRVVHLDPPEPWWPNYKLPPFYPPNPLPGSPPQWILIPPDDHEYPGCPCCFNVVWNECDDKLWSGGRYPLVWNQKYHPSKGFKHSWKIKGDYKEGTIIHEAIDPGTPDYSSFGDQWDNFYFQFEDSHEGADSWSYVTLCKVIAGVCEHCEEYWAMCEGGCDCASETYSFTLDTDTTPETIVPGSSITVAVLGGCGPFSWVVSGVGYSFAKPITQSARGNTLFLVDEPCGAGADAYGMITITDDCGTVVTTEIRNAEAGWKSCMGGAGGPTVCVGPETITLGIWQVTYTCGLGPTNVCTAHDGLTYTCLGETLNWPWFNPLNLCGAACYYGTAYPAGYKCGANQCCYIVLRSIKVWGC